MYPFLYPLVFPNPSSSPLSCQSYFSSTPLVSPLGGHLCAILLYCVPYHFFHYLRPPPSFTISSINIHSLSFLLSLFLLIIICNIISFFSHFSCVESMLFFFFSCLSFFIFQNWPKAMQINSMHLLRKEESWVLKPYFLKTLLYNLSIVWVDFIFLFTCLSSSPARMVQTE